MRIAAIIAAAGRGERLGTDVPKQFLEIGGVSLLERVIRAFDSSGLVHEIIVVLPEGHPSLAVLSSTSAPLRTVTGGARRRDSVAAGLSCVSDDVELVVIHDAARPFVSRAVIERTISAAAESGAAIAAVQAHDTVKWARASRPKGLPPPKVGNGAPSHPAGEGLKDLGDVVEVAETLLRESVYLAQTPQAFGRDVLVRAIASAPRDQDATDEAALVELAGQPVRLVVGDPYNIKVTTEADLRFARLMVGESNHSMDTRVGTGYDLHRLVEGRPLVLGGVRVPFDRGLLGHSDADVVCHAVTDAILGAAGAGDIGTLFPDTDATWKDADSLELLRLAADRLRGRGLVVSNLDVVVIAEAPKIAPIAAEICAKLADAVGVDATRVSVKGKTNEGVGEIGRGEAIAVHAVALVKAVASIGHRS